MKLLPRRSVLVGTAAALAALALPRVGWASGMQIFVKTLTGKTVTLEIHKSDTVAAVKRAVATKTEQEVDSFDLFYGGVKLVEDKPIGEQVTQMGRENSIECIKRTETVGHDETTKTGA